MTREEKPRSRTPKTPPGCIFFLALLPLATPALADDCRPLEWGDLAAVQVFLHQEGYRNLAPIGGKIETKGDQVILHIEAVAPGGLVVEVVLPVEGGNILDEGEQ